jgi:hypothetical protein
LKGSDVKKCFIVFILSVCADGSALASSPDAWQALDRKSAKACISESGLYRVRVGPATRFSDRVMIDARTVAGRYPQSHMNGALAKMLCLYNRKSHRAEVQEFK